MINNKKSLNKYIDIDVNSFTKRFSTIFLLLSTLALIPYILNHIKHGYNKEGKLYHSYLDYPNDLKSEEAIELSNYIKSLHSEWEEDLKACHEFRKSIDDKSRESIYCDKPTNLKKPKQTIRFINKVANELLWPFKPQPKAFSTDLSLRDASVVTIQSKSTNNLGHLPSIPHLTSRPTPLFQTEVSRLISFHPFQYSSLYIQLDGLFFNKDSQVKLRMATPHEEHGEKDHIFLKLTLNSPSDNALSHVRLSETNERSSKHIHIYSRHPSASKTYLGYQLEIIFPFGLDFYNNFELKLNQAHSIKGDLKGIKFKNVTIGLGRGDIDLDNVEADNIKLGNLNGKILGHYFPRLSIASAVVTGSTKIEVHPQTEATRSTIVTVNGPVKVAYKGQPSSFMAHCWLCKPSVTSRINVTSPYLNPSNRWEVKSGHYKTPNESYINIHSKAGISQLVYV